VLAVPTVPYGVAAAPPGDRRVVPRMGTGSASSARRSSAFLLLPRSPNPGADSASLGASAVGSKEQPHCPTSSCGMGAWVPVTCSSTELSSSGIPANRAGLGLVTPAAEPLSLLGVERPHIKLVVKFNKGGARNGAL